MNTINNGFLTKMLFKWIFLGDKSKKYLALKAKKKAVQLRTAFYENR